MLEVISEKTQNLGDDYCIVMQELSNGCTRKISKHGTKINSVRITKKDGSYIETNGNNVKIEELTSDGYLRKYDAKTRKLKRETSPDKITKTFYDNGNVETILDEKNYIVDSFYENGNLNRHEDRNYEVHKDINGNINYELKDGKLTINPEWFSYFRLGVKSRNNPEHWEEKVTLSPKKKTLLSLGGNLTTEADIANGNSNIYFGALGLNEEQKNNMQLVSGYRPDNDHLRFIWYRIGGMEQHIENDYKREILQKFMPFMARRIDDKFERLHPQELLNNFANIMIQAHCYGASDLPRINKIFKQTMTKLGYSEDLQKSALKQILCVTNNSQRDMTDNLDFTCIHRYSVRDGQFVPEYDTAESAEYPVFVQDYPAFAAQKGRQAAFIQTKPHEMIMVYDKILSDESQKDEHLDAFWTTDESMLSPIGKYQARLMAKIGQFWYNNHTEISDVAKFLQKITQGSNLSPFVQKALTLGAKIKAEKKNALINHHILKSAWNKFNNPLRKPLKNGIYKLLSDNSKE